MSAAATRRLPRLLNLLASHLLRSSPHTLIQSRALAVNQCRARSSFLTYASRNAVESAVTAATARRIVDPSAGFDSNEPGSDSDRSRRPGAAGLLARRRGGEGP